MKTNYTLLAMMGALFTVAGPVYAADASDAANVRILRHTVDINRGTSSVTATVTAQIQVLDGKTFDAPVYPVLYSVSGDLEYGEADGQQITLPAAGRNITGTLTWTVGVSPALLRDTNQSLLCIMYFRDSIGKGVELSSVEVNSSGTTGITDMAADIGTTTEIYDIAGVPVTRGENINLTSLPHGVYILRSGMDVSKIVR